MTTTPQHVLKFTRAYMVSSVRIGAIKRAVAEFYAVKPETFRSKRKDALIIWPRQVVQWLAREVAGYPFQAIANEFKCDHGTVMHNAKKVQNWFEVHKEIRIELLELKKQVEELKGKV